MKRIQFSDFEEKALSNPDVAGEYNKGKPIYELRRQLMVLRKEAGLTQDQLAEKLHTKKVISPD